MTIEATPVYTIYIGQTPVDDQPMPSVDRTMRGSLTPLDIDDSPALDAAQAAPPAPRAAQRARRFTRVIHTLPAGQRRCCLQGDTRTHAMFILAFVIIGVFLGLLLTKKI